MIALKYGTIPIVRATGGLEDSIIGYPLDGADGFKFFNYNANDMLGAIHYAIDTYKDKKTWKTLIKNAMKADFSWNLSAKEYIKVYESLLS